MRSRPRYLLLLAAALPVVAVAGVFTASSFADDRPLTIAQHCDRFSASSAAAQRLVTGKGDRVVVIGDSYSVGLGLARPADAWSRELPGRVHVYGFSGSGFSRAASPCRRVDYADRAAAAVRTDPALVVVEGGLNDFNQTDDAIRAGFEALTARLGDRKVLVVGPASAPSRAAGAARVDRVLAAECAEAGIPYLRMYDHRFSYLADELHLTPAGHRAFGKIVAAAVEAQ